MNVKVHGAVETWLAEEAQGVIHRMDPRRARLSESVMAMEQAALGHLWFAREQRSSIGTLSL